MAIKRKIKKSTSYEQIPLEQAFDEFIMEKEAKNLSQDTLRNYKQSYELFMAFNELGSDTPTDEISISNFHKWINAMKHNGVKPASINHYLRDCRAFFYWCMDDNRQYITPAFKISMIEGQEEQIKLFTDKEIAALLEKPRKKDSFADWRSWAIVNWVLGTGNRAATICEVKLGDIDFNCKEIALKHTKNKRAQIIPLSPALENALKEYIRIWRRYANDDAWLFPNVGEEKLTTNALRHSFSRYCEDRGVEKTNIHGLRHNFAKGWIKNNGNMFALQKILGHSTLEMTKRYVKLFSDDIKEDYDKYSPLDTIKRNGKRTQLVKRA